MSVLSIAELDELLDQIRAKVCLANRTGQIDELLASWGLLELVNDTAPLYATNKKGKILVIGDSEINKDRMLSIAKNLGIDKNRFEFELDWDKFARFDFRKLRNNDNYSLVMLGPLPHSCSGKADSSSIITELETGCGYPKTTRIRNEHGLKITNSTFKNALTDLISNGVL